MKLTPLYDRVVVKPAPPEEVTKGGIIIPDTAKEKPQQGEVVAVGKGKLTEDGNLIPLQVKVGDQVLFGKYAGTEITIDGEDYLIMRESDIYAIVNVSGK
ncbi:MAG: co-chaperone GroES [Candidatus Kapabacteria bacterium]|nr:co-chaperone GroES [Candidatus Kapabacteria bacterium]MCS7169179.1 co-chaperone GroES [Candidatus Kapabacteria bacterium]MDW7996778.1 co-chaperone GroES [Bacteroidota bacterium]MDW8225481.1 co-chaperone GroES [Bacteroidota bacterium]